MSTTPTSRKPELHREHYRGLLQRSGVALIVGRGVELEVEIINDTFTRLFGYTKEDIPDVAHWWPLAYPDEVYREAVKSEWQRRVANAIANQSAIEPMEAKVRCRDGSERYIEFHFSSLEDISIVSFVDLTERNMAEEALRKSEEKFLKAFRGSPVAITLSRIRDQRFIEVNDNFERLTGYRREEVIERTVSEIGLWINPSKREELRTRLLSERNLHEVELDFRTKTGSMLTCLVSAELIEVGKEPCILSIAFDITQRKLAQEALQQSEERFQNVFQESGVGMVIVSPEGRFIAANKAFCDCLGYTEPELLDKAVESVTFPEDWPGFSQRLADTLTERHGFQWFEKRCLHKNGRIVYTQSNATVIRGREGDPQYLIGQVLDITDRKKAEAAVVEMSRKLVEAQEQERARIARELHDDVNQRLAVLVAELEQLQHKPLEVESRVPVLQERIIEIANDVQALSRELHSGNLEYLGSIKGLKSWCNEFSERQNVEINFRSDVSSVVPLDIGICFLRVLQEALHNALKHSGTKRIEVQLSEHSGDFHLIIHDSGRGFDVEAAKQGRGLGLTSMQERLRLANGTLKIQSKLMGGTTIDARVPLKSEALSVGAVG